MSDPKSPKSPLSPKSATSPKSSPLASDAEDESAEELQRKKRERAERKAKLEAELAEKRRLEMEARVKAAGERISAMLREDPEEVARKEAERKAELQAAFDRAAAKKEEEERAKAAALAALEEDPDYQRRMAEEEAEEEKRIAAEAENAALRNEVEDGDAIRKAGMKTGLLKGGNNRAVIQQTCFEGWKKITKIKIMICKDPESLATAGDGIQNDFEMVEAAVVRRGQTLRHASAELKQERKLVIQAVEQHGMALQYADYVFRKDKDIVLAAVKKDGEALSLADPALQKSRDIVLPAVQQNGMALVSAQEKLRNDMEIVEAAVVSSGMSIRFASSHLRNNRKLGLEALKKSQGGALPFLSDALRNDPDFAASADPDGMVEPEGGTWSKADFRCAYPLEEYRPSQKDWRLDTVDQQGMPLAHRKPADFFVRNPLYDLKEEVDPKDWKARRAEKQKEYRKTALDEKAMKSGARASIAVTGEARLSLLSSGAGSISAKSSKSVAFET